MKKVPCDILELGRITHNPALGFSDVGDMSGAFTVFGPTGLHLNIISSGHDDHYGWEHVSVSTPKRAPNWKEMCFVKDLFWDEEECVIQYHPPKSEYVNHHPNCLHMWRPRRQALPLPPHHLVGPKPGDKNG